MQSHFLVTSRMVAIPFLLGYQDCNPFTRTLRYWTGMTPGEYRRSGDCNTS